MKRKKLTKKKMRKLLQRIADALQYQADLVDSAVEIGDLLRQRTTLMDAYDAELAEWRLADAQPSDGIPDPGTRPAMPREYVFEATPEKKLSVRVVGGRGARKR